jgi:glycosyltransferase involved in cell wall biosynthesis
MSREKRPDRVIEIACAAGIPVKMAAKIDAVDRAYFETTIKPLMNSPWVEFVGEIGDHEKDDFLGKALACLFPVDWPEPFGLAMIEALACGTPVIAFGNGSVPEIVEDGVTGFIVDSVQSAVEAVGRVASVDRSECRASFEKRFTVTRMAQEYLKVYNQFVGQTDAADRALLNRSATGIQVISGGV